MSQTRKVSWFGLKILYVLLVGEAFLFVDVANGLEENTINKSNSKLPNIIILFADNLGYDDISLFQQSTTMTTRSKPKTPNVDRIGHEGMKLTNWNSAAALCSASRSALLTGRYPVRTGTYPRVFRPDATYGLLPNEDTIAELLKNEGYATSIVGKWHLGHREPFLPTNQGFDTWQGIPYHMSGGSIDNHECNNDINHTMWLPLYQNASIIQQPVKLEELASRYSEASTSFMKQNIESGTPFFLYMAFSHVHQLCAPRDFPEQETCQWSSSKENTTFSDAVEEMDWITGQILNALDEYGAANDTIVVFTSDNGPWVAEQACSGSKGPFKGEWFQKHADVNCTACPHDYVPDPTSNRPRRCILPGTGFTLDGVHCGEDTGLGSVWEANLRMPAVIRYPGRIQPGSESSDLVSTLDVIPTLLQMIKKTIPSNLDGVDVSNIFFQTKEEELEINDGDHKHSNRNDRVLFFWRDGFQDGPLPSPYGRFDIAAVKMGSRLKAWFWTKSAHYNDDIEDYHDPPLLFDTISDPAESFPLNPDDYQDTIRHIKELVQKHKESIDWTLPLALFGNNEYIPCVNQKTGCRTHSPEEENLVAENPPLIVDK